MSDLSPARVIADINSVNWTNQFQQITGDIMQTLLLEIVELYMNPPTGSPNPRFPSGSISPLAASYTSGKLIAQSADPALCSPVTIVAAALLAGGSGVISRLRQVSSDTAVLSKTIRTHIHETAPVFTGGAGDNWLDSVSDAGWCGSFDVLFTAEFVLAAVNSAKGIGVPNQGTIVNFLTALPTTNLYLTFEARDTFTLASGAMLNTILECY